MAVGLFLKSEILQRAAYGLFILGAITAVAAASTGEGAEEVIEGMNGMEERFIKIHEEIAEVFAILLYILGGLSIIGLWANWKKKSFSKILTYLTLALSLVVLFYAKQVGTTGGEIRHTEIRADQLNNNAVIKESEHEEDDD